MTQDQHEPYHPQDLPPVLAEYLEAHRTPGRRSSAAEVFATDARVVDDGREHVGTEEIRDWLEHEASVYTYTTTFTGQRAEGPDRWTVLAHLEGDFPGGTVDLHFRFRLQADRVVELVIEP